MKTRRVFQVILAILATIAALAFLTAAIFVLIPLVTGNKMPILGNLVDGIQYILQTTHPDTTQMVIVESFVLIPFVFCATAAILLFSNHGIQGLYKFSYILLMLGVGVTGITMCIYSKALYGAQWLMLLFINIAVVILYLLLSILTWLIKVDPAEEKAARDLRKAKRAAKKQGLTVVTVPAEETAESKQYRITAKRMEILHGLLEEKKINQQMYVALTDYVMKKNATTTDASSETNSDKGSDENDNTDTSTTETDN